MRVLNRGYDNSYYIKNVTVTNNSNIIKLELMFSSPGFMCYNKDTECYYCLTVVVVVVVVSSSYWWWWCYGGGSCWWYSGIVDSGGIRFDSSLLYYYGKG